MSFQHVMRFAEAAQEVKVHKAVEKPKYDAGYAPGRRKLAAAGVKVATPRAPVPITNIYSLPPFPKYAEVISVYYAPLLLSFLILPLR